VEQVGVGLCTISGGGVIVGSPAGMEKPSLGGS